MPKQFVYINSQINMFANCRISEYKKWCSFLGSWCPKMFMTVTVVYSIVEVNSSD